VGAVTPAWWLALFCAGAAFLYACSLHRFTWALHYVYIGGMEVAEGRLPFRDFGYMAGALPLFIQAAFFKLLGPGYASSYVLHAALLNGLAVVMTADVVLRRTGQALWAAAAGAVCCVWFYALFMAVPWYDHEAHFFLIASVWVLHRWSSSASVVLAGGVAAFSFYCKQSHGAFGLIFLCLYVWTARGFRAAVAYTVGGTAVVLGIAGVFSTFAGWRPFYHDFIYLPTHSERVYFTKQPLFWALGAPLAAILLWAERLKPWRLFAVPLALSAAAVAVVSWQYLVFLLPLALWPWLSSVEERALVLALALIQLDGRLTSHNEIKVYWPFLGLFVAAAAAALARLGEFPLAALGRRWLWTSWAFLVLWGVRLSYLHKVRSLFPGTTALAAGLLAALAAWTLRERALARRPRLLAAGLLLLGSGGLAARCASVYARRLDDPAKVRDLEETRAARRIQEPVLRGVEMAEPEARGVEAVLPKLRALPPESRPVFLYGECDLFYPLIGQPLPRHWWFDPTFSFVPGEAADRAIIDMLEGGRYRTLVFCPGFAEFAEMPGVNRWLAERAEPAGTLEGFRFLRIRDSP
jgi:hypothetical protein